MLRKLSAALCAADYLRGHKGLNDLRACLMESDHLKG